MEIPAFKGSGVSRTNPCTPTALRQGFFYHPDPLDSARYVQCTEWGTPLLRRCPPFQVWSVEYAVCVTGDRLLTTSGDDVASSSGPSGGSGNGTPGGESWFSLDQTPSGAAVDLAGSASSVVQQQQQQPPQTLAQTNFFEQHQRPTSVGVEEGTLNVDGSPVYRRPGTDWSSEGSTVVQNQPLPQGYYKSYWHSEYHPGPSVQFVPVSSGRATSNGGGIIGSQVGGGIGRDPTTTGGISSDVGGNGGGGSGNVQIGVNPCLLPGVRFFPHPASANRFYECVGGQLAERMCAADQVWLQIGGRCGVVNQPGQPQPQPQPQQPVGGVQGPVGLPINPCSGSVTRFLPFPGDNSKYIVCSESTVLGVRSCGVDQVWLQDLQRCATMVSLFPPASPSLLPPTQSTSSAVSGGAGTGSGSAGGLDSSSTSTSGGGFQTGIAICRGNDSFYHSYPPDKTRFLQCDEYGNVYLRSCGPHKVWKDDVKTCVGGNNVTFPVQSSSSSSSGSSASSGFGGSSGGGTVTAKVVCPLGFQYDQPSGFCVPANNGGASTGGNYNQNNGGGAGSTSTAVCPPGYTWNPALSVCLQTVNIDGTTGVVFASGNGSVSANGGGSGGGTSTTGGGTTATAAGTNSTVTAGRLPVPAYIGDNPCGRGQGFYFQFPNSTAFFLQCDVIGNVFVQACPPNLVWDQTLVTCVNRIGSFDSGRPNATIAGGVNQTQYQATAPVAGVGPITSGNGTSAASPGGGGGVASGTVPANNGTAGANGTAIYNDINQLGASYNLFLNPCANANDGDFFQHPAEPSSFIVCDNRRPAVRYCPEGQIWDQGILTCRP